MDPAEYPRMFQAETRHWWYLGMNAISRALLRRFLPPAPTRKILDAGCGTGAAMAFLLPEFGEVSGMDNSPLALKGCRARGLTRLAQASVEASPFPAESFDLLVSFDVLYESGVRSDERALAEFFRLLRPGGWLLLRLPAYNFLRGQHDRTVHTARRYRASQLIGLLRQCGFLVRHCTYANTWLFPLIAAKRLAERFFPPAPGASDVAFSAGLLNRPLEKLLASEAPLAARFSLPFGLSVFALAQKPLSA
ncbi:MAG: class I SAM-dependent methyltransferase [Anaerolineales bacterium]